ncbi:MAG: metal ABC transporter permease [Syntrophaceae bacterium]
MDIFEYLQYGFIQRALLCGSFIALLCSTLGVLLVLRRFSLIGDGLAHVTFGSVALGLFLRVYPLYISLPVVMLSSLGILKLTQRARLYGDAAIGIVSSVGIAGGVILASVAGGFNVDLFSYLFGNILAIGKDEMYLSIALSIAVLAVIVLYFQEIFSMTFDEEFARVSGIATERLNTLLVLLTAITVVLSMNVVGIMLISALLILPAVTALQLARGFRTAMLISACAALASVVGGIFISLALNLPTGATIVLTNFVLFLVAFAIRNLRHRRPAS